MHQVLPLILEQPVPHLPAWSCRRRAGSSAWGVPGSGKTTVAAQLAEEVNARTAPGTMLALGMDGFHLTKAELRWFPDPVEAFARRGAPWTFDVAALERRLRFPHPSLSAAFSSSSSPSLE